MKLDGLSRRLESINLTSTIGSDGILNASSVGKRLRTVRFKSLPIIFAENGKKLIVLINYKDNKLRTSISSLTK